MKTKANLLKNLIREEVRRQLNSKSLTEAEPYRVNVGSYLKRNYKFAYELFNATYPGDVKDLGELLRKRDELLYDILEKYGDDPILDEWHWRRWWNEEREEFLLAGDEVNMKDFAKVESRGQRIIKGALNWYEKKGDTSSPLYQKLKDVTEANAKILAWWKNQKFKDDGKPINSGKYDITAVHYR